MINASLRDISCPHQPPASQMRTVCVAFVAVAMLLPCGCVRRRLNVRSNPPGALVYVDNQQIGTTPCSVDFTYYGTREIRLVKPGYETLTLNQPIPAPWYQIPPLDFFSENLVPTKIRDNRTVCYDLAPQVIVPREQLVDRANQLRQDTLQYPVAPAGAAIPIGPAGPPGVIAPPGTVPQFSAPFAPPMIPSTTPSVVPQQQGVPIVSPPLR
jgi:PEGA domain-containing protein